MILFLLAYLGGVLTIISPCILPVLPFVFARADRPFLKSGLPMLAGMAATFALVATLASVAGGWAVQANAAGRWIAMALLALFGVTLLFPVLADRVTRPLVALGGRLSASADAQQADGKGLLLPSLVLGVATGLLWAPCAGPVLGLILTGAAISGANAATSLLLLAYALGAATSLALALLVGGRVFAAMKTSLGASEWIRRGLGVAVLLAVVAIALGLDTGVLTKLSLASTGGLEQAILDKVHPKPAGGAALTNGAAMTGGPAMQAQGAAGGGLPVYGPMPPLTGVTDWLNSPPLTAEGLKGKVVLIDFWTYSCINCLRALPYVEAWSKQYAAQGLVVIGVHAPEFAFEKQKANVVKAVKDFGITYPVAMDNNYAIWKAFQNDSWPAHYFIDAKGQIRFMHSGEGAYDESETVIRTLLAERNGAPVSGGLVGKAGSGVEAAADFSNAMSVETYLGYGRARPMASPNRLHKDQAFTYAAPSAYKADDWSLIGPWTVTKEYATNTAPGAKITFSFHARDLHMVLGPSADGKPVRFRITLDGKAPGAHHGLDTDAGGLGTVTSQRLYQLVRQPGIRESDKDVLFQIEFLDAGAQAFTFTFG